MRRCASSLAKAFKQAPHALPNYQLSLRRQPPPRGTTVVPFPPNRPIAAIHASDSESVSVINAMMEHHDRFDAMEEKLRDMGAENRDMGAELRRVGAELRRVTADMNVIKNRLALFLPTEQAAYVVKVLCNQPGATKASRKEVKGHLKKAISSLKRGATPGSADGLVDGYSTIFGVDKPRLLEVLSLLLSACDEDRTWHSDIVVYPTQDLPAWAAHCLEAALAAPREELALQLSIVRIIIIGIEREGVDIATVREKFDEAWRELREAGQL